MAAEREMGRALDRERKGVEGVEEKLARPMCSELNHS